MIDQVDSARASMYDETLGHRCEEREATNQSEEAVVAIMNKDCIL